MNDEIDLFARHVRMEQGHSILLNCVPQPPSAAQIAPSSDHSLGSERVKE